MSLRTVIMAAVAALLGGVFGAFILDHFPQIMRTALSTVGLHEAVNSAAARPVTDYAQFAAREGDSDAAIKDKKERCWVAAYAQFPTVAKRIPLGKDAGVLVRDNARPTDAERAEFQAFMNVIPACRALTRAYDQRTIPPAQHALLAKLDEVFAQKDLVYRAAIDGELAWGDFAQKVIDIDRDLTQFKKQLREKLQPQQEQQPKPQ